MNKDLLERILVQLEPDLAQELSEEVIKIEKQLKALEIIKECTGLSMIVNRYATLLCVPLVNCYESLPSNQMIISVVVGKENIDCLKEVLE